MAFWENFPYTNFHEMNLEWVVTEVKKLRTYVEQYTAVNNVSYGGIWNISKQYPQWSIVSYGDKSYLSLSPVPAGVDISNDDYWLELADLDPRYGGLVVAIERLNGERTYSFDSVESMAAHDDLESGVIAFCASRNGYNVLTAWVISDNREDFVSINLANGKFANYIAISEPLNVLGLGVVKSPVSSTELVNQLLASGKYNKLYFPEGEYTFSAIVRNTVQIYGSNQTQYSPSGGEFLSKYDTIFHPDNGPVISMVAVNTAITNCIYENFEIVGDDTLSQSNVGIRVDGTNDTEFCDFCIFNNLLIRNCRTGLSWNARGIWNTFNNVRLYGNLTNGALLSPPEGCAFNHNSFNDCQFAYNGACGIYMSSGREYQNESISFNHCNIESNYYRSEPGTDQFAVWLYNCHGVSFIDCYIEANNGTCTFWLNYSDAIIVGGSSLVPKNPLIGAVNGSKCLVTGLSGFNTEEFELCMDISENNSVCIIGKDVAKYKTDAATPTVLW